jgi:hypothetical protein
MSSAAATGLQVEMKARFGDAMQRSVSSVLALVAVMLVSSAMGQTSKLSNKGKDDELSAKRLELMQQKVASVKVKSSEEDFPVEFVPKPIFRYSDPARGYVAAAVWKLGETERPRALMTTELHRFLQGSPRIVYEYLSLTPSPFSAVSDDCRWEPEGTAVEFKPIPGAAAPEETPQRRLLQARALAKRFGANELVHGQKCELRLVPQPIDRYTPSSARRADGAIFLLAFGTNPEIALFIESDGTAWNFGAGRLTAATTVILTLDDSTAWEGAVVRNAVDSPYTASSAPADVPGIAADGSEIEE